MGFYERHGPVATPVGHFAATVVVRESDVRCRFEVVLVHEGSTEPVLGRAVQLTIADARGLIPLQAAVGPWKLLPGTGRGDGVAWTATFDGRPTDTLRPRARLRVGRHVADVPLIRGRPLDSPERR